MIDGVILVGSEENLDLRCIHRYTSKRDRPVCYFLYQRRPIILDPHLYGATLYEEDGYLTIVSPLPNLEGIS
jgi:hypothetical protein